MDERNTCSCSPETSQNLEVESSNTYTSFCLATFNSLLANTPRLPQTTTVELQAEVAKLEKYQKELLEQKLLIEQQVLQDKVKHGVQELEALAEHINALAGQLEAEMLKFKEIAADVNRSYHEIQQPQPPKNKSEQNNFRPLNIWEVHCSSVPVVIRRGAKFILTEKIINLFKAESQIDATKQAETAQKRRKALEHWLIRQQKNS